MVIRIQPDIFQIVVLAPGANAFLRVRSSWRIVWAGLLPEKDGHELVHSRVREKQVRRIGHQTRRRHNGVLLRFEKIEERLAYFAAGHSTIRWRLAHLWHPPASGKDVKPTFGKAGCRFGKKLLLNLPKRPNVSILGTTACRTTNSIRSILH